MTEPFVANNGVQLFLDEEGALANKYATFYANRGHVEALREYFRDERDTELGRWRWPENPDYVVYPDELEYVTGKKIVRVMRESTGNREWFTVAGFKLYGGDNDFTLAANAYLAAHPEKKPWHDAKDGHLYLLNFKDTPNVDVSALVKGGTFVYNDPCCDGWDVLDSDSIKSARRIWPESKES